MVDEQVSSDPTIARLSGQIASLQNIKRIAEAKIEADRQQVIALCERLAPGALDRLKQRDPVASQWLRLVDFLAIIERSAAPNQREAHEPNQQLSALMDDQSEDQTFKLKAQAEHELAQNLARAKAHCERLAPGMLEQMARADPTRLRRMRLADFLDVVERQVMQWRTVQDLGKTHDVDLIQALTAAQAGQQAAEAELEAIRQENAGLQRRLSNVQQVQIAAVLAQPVTVDQDLPTERALPFDHPQPVTEDLLPTLPTPHATPVQTGNLLAALPTDEAADTPVLSPAHYVLKLIATGEYRWTAHQAAVVVAYSPQHEAPDRLEGLRADLRGFLDAYAVTRPTPTYLLDLNAAGRAELEARCGLRAGEGQLKRLLDCNSQAQDPASVVWAVLSVAAALPEVDLFQAETVAGFRPALLATLEGHREAVFVFEPETLPAVEQISAYLKTNRQRLCAVTLEAQDLRNLVTHCTQAVEKSDRRGSPFDLYVTSSQKLLSSASGQSVWTKRTFGREKRP